jgi:hypothetical protein
VLPEETVLEDERSPIVNAGTKSVLAACARNKTVGSNNRTIGYGQVSPREVNAGIDVKHSDGAIAADNHCSAVAVQDSVGGNRQRVRERDGSITSEQNCPAGGYGGFEICFVANGHGCGRQGCTTGEYQKEVGRKSVNCEARSTTFHKRPSNAEIIRDTSIKHKTGKSTSSVFLTLSTQAQPFEMWGC